MVKIKYCFALLIALFISCAVRENNFETKLLKTLELSHLPQEDTTYYIKDTQIDIFLNKNDPKINIHVYKNKNRFKFLKIYSKRNYRYLGGGGMFYDVLYGTWMYYDDNGKLIEERNYDEPYKFSVDQLIKKMKKNYHVNLAVDDEEIYRHIHVVRWVLEDKKPYYILSYLTEERTHYKKLIVDGKTGKTLVFKKLTIDSAMYMTRSLVDIYFDSINKVKMKK